METEIDPKLIYITALLVLPSETKPGAGK